MPTNDRAISIYPKRLLSLTGLKTNWLQFLKDEINEVSAAIFQGQSGVLDQDEIELTSSANDTFDLDLTNASRVLVGGGQIIDLSLITGVGITSAIPFENATGVTYSVGIKYAEVVDGVEANPRTGDPEYPKLKQTYGEVDTPDSVVDNTTYIRLTINSITGASEDHSGRTCRVWLVDPVSLIEGPAATAAYFEGTVGYSSPNNYVDIPYSGAAGPLGQDTGSGPPSTTALDYKVFIEGASWRNKANKDLSLDSDYAFIGEILGNGPTAIPVVFDVSGQIPIFINSLDRAYDGPSGSGSGRQIFVDSEAIEMRSRSGSNDELRATLRIDRKGGTEVGGICLQTISDEMTEGTEANAVHLIPITHAIGNLTANTACDSTAVDTIARSGTEDFVVSNVSQRCDLAWLQGFSTIDGLYQILAVTASTLQLRGMDGSTPAFPIGDGPGTLTLLRAVQTVNAVKWGSIFNPLIRGKGGTGFIGSNEGAAASGDGGDDVLAATVFYGDEVDALHALEQNATYPKVVTWINKEGVLKTISGIVIAPSALPANPIAGLLQLATGVNGITPLDWLSVPGEALGLIQDVGGALREVTESTGRRADPHHFKDDFHYHENRWTGYATGVPLHYELVRSTANADAFMIGGGNTSWDDWAHGGTLAMQCDTASIDTIAMTGPFNWWIDPSEWLSWFFCRCCMNYDPVLDTDRVTQIGLQNFTSVARITFEMDYNTHGNSNWWIVCVSGANTKKADLGFGPLYDGANNPKFSNFQFVITGNQTIRYRGSSMSAPADLDLSTATPGPIDLSAIANKLMGPWAFVGNGDTALHRFFLDRWEVSDQEAMTVLGDSGNQVY